MDSRGTKYWSEMYIADGNSNHSDFIISKKAPVKYDDSKKVVLTYQIDPSEYEEISEFYRQYNKMATGNTTLLPVPELRRYLSFDNTCVVMRSESGNKLMGVIISIELPIRNIENNRTEIITHGCTTFLNVHPIIRGHGMGMILIRGLIWKGFEKKIYCDYHTVHFQIGDNSVELDCYYRPINLKRCVELGFLFPDCYNQNAVTRVRLRYRTKLPPNHRYEKIINNNLNEALEYYRESIKDKKFAFYPDNDLWKKWVVGFPTYLIYKNNKIEGIVSLNVVHCVITGTGKEGKIVTPVICNGNMGSVLPVLVHISEVLKYDVLYFHQYGDVGAKDLESINCVKNTHTTWFSLYNNQITLDVSDLSVPLL